MPATRAFSAARCLHRGLALANPTQPPPPARRCPLRRGELLWGCKPATPARPPAPAASDDEEASDLITGGGAATIRCCRQPWTWRRGHPGAGRRAHAIQDFKTSAHSSHRPSSPRQEGILTLKSFMIPYPKLCDLPSDSAGGLAMISWPISWSISCLISYTYDIRTY
jgi:hypothetical protein